MVQKRRHFESLRKEKKDWTLTAWSAIQDVLRARPDLVLTLSSTHEQQEDLKEWLNTENLTGMIPLSVHKEDRDTPAIYCIVKPQLVTVQEVLREKPHRILCIDHVTNAGNVGAMLRTMAFFGWDTVIVPSHRQGLFNTATAVASAGAIVSTKILQVGSLAGCLRQIKDEAGYLVIGAEALSDPTTALESAKHFKLDDWFESPNQPVVLVVGSEDTGLSESVREACDKLCDIPSRLSKKISSQGDEANDGPIWHQPTVQNSLNVSVAAGILIYRLG